MMIDTGSLQLEEALYFPTQIFSTTLESATATSVNRNLTDLIYEEREKDSEGIQRSNFRSLGGWHSHNHLHKDPEYADIVSLINACGESVCQRNQYKSETRLKIGTMWAIINPPGSSNRAHIHPGCLWSGVYYIATPEDCGNIEFIDPRTQNLMTPPRFGIKQKRPRHCWTKVNYTPTPGKLLIFPSWLYHSVAPNLSTEKGAAADRLIISFNLNQVG